MGTQPERLEVDEYHRVGLSIVRWLRAGGLRPDSNREIRFSALRNERK